MGSTASVPPAFEVAVADGRQLVTLRTPVRAPRALGVEGGDATPRSPQTVAGWLSLQQLVLDAGAPAGTSGGTKAKAKATAKSTAKAKATAASGLRNRRTRLRGATVDVYLAPLNRALAVLPLTSAGISDVRLWMAPGGPRLAGTFAAGNRRATFTIRPTIGPHADERRRARVILSDVRVYGILPLPASLIGVALARALGSGIPDGGAAVRGSGPSLDVDPLETALEHVLVPGGWRLPDLGSTWLEAIELAAGDGAVRLRFAGGPPVERLTASTGNGAALVPEVEGERLPDAALAAEERLNAGDVIAAEVAYRAVARQSPTSRPVRARLLALRTAAGGADAGELAAAMVEEWPDFIPGLLGVALAAGAAGDPERAADAFGRVAVLCERHDEREDATLARAAEAEARAAAEHIRHLPLSPTELTELPDTTQQDPEPADALADVVAQQTTTTATPTTASPATEGAPAAITPAAEPQPPGLAEQTDQAIARGDLAEADALFALRLEATHDGQEKASLMAERARVQLLGPEGVRRALGTLRALPLGEMPEEGLVLRADLAERVGELTDARATLGELMVRAEAAGDAAYARALARRQTELATAAPDDASGPLGGPERHDNDNDNDHDNDTLPPTTDPSAVPEQVRATDSGGVTGRTAALYATHDDGDTLARALGDLLEGFEALEPERRHAAYASFGRVAESTGDLEHAEEAFWRATHAAGDPEGRANDLVAHARVLMSRGNVAAANAELEEALATVPRHAGALAVMADRAFHARDWTRARHYYALLDGAPAAAEAIPRETLVHRRAVLARAAGDLPEAEACYRELALLDPRDIEARQALAEMAMARGDLRTAADRWEEILPLLPLHALGELLDVRQRLADVYVRLAHWGAARYYAELVLAQDPGRLPTLERMAEIDERLGLFPAAVNVLDRLARLYSQPSKRAEALFRQGEILLTHMNEPERAFEAHLKASDLDPRFTPTMVRLIEGYWRAGDWGEAAAVGDDLGRAGPLPVLSPLLRLRWTLAAALARQDPTAAMEATQLGALPWNAELAAEGLAEAAVLLANRPPRELGPATAVIEAWASHDSAAEQTASSGDGVVTALRARVQKDPAAPGAARALGWIAECAGDPLAARTWFSLVTFLDEGDGAAERLDELGNAPAPAETGLDLLGPAEHPDAGGSAAPLRRALAALAHGLCGLGADADARASDGASAVAAGAELDGLCAGLVRALGAPATTAVLIDGPGADVRVRVVGGRPNRLEIPAPLAGIPRDELTFLLAEALDRLRAGLSFIDEATDGGADAVESVLGAAAAALAAGDDPVPPEMLPDPLAERVAEALAATDRLLALLEAPGGASATLELDLDHGRDVLAVWDAFRAGAERASDRFATLACRSPLGALRAIYRTDPGAPGGSEREGRIALLRTPRVRELLRFLGGPQYARSVGLVVGDESA